MRKQSGSESTYFRRHFNQSPWNDLISWGTALGVWYLQDKVEFITAWGIRLKQLGVTGTNMIHRRIIGSVNLIKVNDGGRWKSLMDVTLRRTCWSPFIGSCTPGIHVVCFSTINEGDKVRWSIMYKTLMSAKYAVNIVRLIMASTREDGLQQLEIEIQQWNIRSTSTASYRQTQDLYFSFFFKFYWISQLQKIQL